MTAGRITLALVLAILLALPHATAARPPSPSLQELINHERAAHGLAPLQPAHDLVTHAARWAATMAHDNALTHRTRAQLAAPLTRWTLLGENVGRTTSANPEAALLTAFMRSPAHRDNILGPYTHAAIGQHHHGSTTWVAITFVTVERSHVTRTRGAPAPPA